MRAGTSDPPGARVRDAELQLEAAAPGFLDRVRAEAGKRALADLDGTDVGAALVAIEELSDIDLDVPTASRRPVVRYAKQLVKRVVRWYLGYIGRQVTALGHAIAHYGTVMDDRATKLEGRVSGVEASIAEMAGRIERLERGAPRK
jgi:hypothetical protein